MKKITITVGIPAFNEEHNIENLIVSVANQRRKNFILKEIIVSLDASTDRTGEKVEKLAKKYTFVTLIKNTIRKGKYARVSELFASCKTDALVILGLSTNAM